MTNRIDLNLLAALEALLQAGSVSGAAERMGVGQPAMSAALGRIRELFDDPMFLRVPGGMTPTSRALALQGELTAVLARLRALVEPAEAFDPGASRRVFRISGGDYVGMVLLPKLAAALEQTAPEVDLRFRFIEKDRLPACLDAEEIDLALCVLNEPPARFLRETLFEEDFVCVARAGHPILAAPLSPAVFAAQRHLLLTERGDERGAIDTLLERQGLRRRIVLTVPQASLVADVLLGTELIATVGRRLAARLGRDGIRHVDLPFPTARWRMSVVSARRRESDAGLAWLRSFVRASFAEVAPP